MKKALALILALSLAVSSFAACGAASSSSSAAASGSTSAPAETTGDTSVSFSWWGGDSRHEATQKAVADYMAANPNVTITTDYGAWSGWEDKMSAALYAGTAPDLNQTNWNWLFNYDNSGATFVDLNDYADYIDLTQFSDAALEQCTVNGRLTGIPIAMTGRIFYWNADTFASAGVEIPTTFADLMAAGETFKTKLGDDYYPLVMGEYDRMIFMVYYLECKYGKAWVQDGAMQYTAEEIAEGLQVLKDMEAAHVIPTIQTIAGDGAESLDKNPKWSEGKYAGILEWDSSASKFSAALNNPDAFTVGEYFTDIGEYKGGFTKVSSCFAISQSAKDPVAAAKFMNYMLNEEDGVKALASERGIPCSATALKICTDEDLLNKTVAEANSKVIDWCSFGIDPTFEDAGLKSTDGVYYDVMAGVSYGDYSVEDGAKVLMDGVSAVLEG